jgi:hypothetical protein
MLLSRLRAVGRFATGMVPLLLCSACSAPPVEPPAPTSEAIQLPPGATRATLDSVLPASGSRDYVVPLASGQLLTVLASASADLRVAVSKAGETVEPIVTNAQYWAGYATGAGDYTVTVSGPAETAYTVSIHKPRRLARAAGEGQSALGGLVGAHGEVDYAVRVATGERLQVELRTDVASAYMSVLRLHDGKVVLDHGSEADVLEFVADADGDYLISVIGGATAAEYRLVVGHGR